MCHLDVRANLFGPSMPKGWSDNAALWKIPYFSKYLCYLNFLKYLIVKILSTFVAPDLCHKWPVWYDRLLSKLYYFICADINCTFAKQKLSRSNLIMHIVVKAAMSKKQEREAENGTWASTTNSSFSQNIRLHLSEFDFGKVKVYFLEPCQITSITFKSAIDADNLLKIHRTNLKIKSSEKISCVPIEHNCTVVRLELVGTILWLAHFLFKSGARRRINYSCLHFVSIHLDDYH